MEGSRILSVCIAGATGWTGRALVPAVHDASDLTLRSAVSRSAAGRDLGEALGGAALRVPVYGTVADALDGVDVLVDYTHATAVKANVLAAVQAGVAGRSGRRGPPPGGLRGEWAAPRPTGGGLGAACSPSAPGEKRAGA